MLAVGRTTFETQEGMPPDPACLLVGAHDNNTLYGWRRDAEGIPVSRAATLKEPVQDAPLGYFHLLLRAAGAQEHANGYLHKKRVGRVLRGAGQGLSQMKASFLVATSETPLTILAGWIENPTNSGMPSIQRHWAPLSQLHVATKEVNAVKNITSRFEAYWRTPYNLVIGEILRAIKRAAISCSPSNSHLEMQTYGSCKGPATHRRLLDVPPFNSEVHVVDTVQPNVAAASNVLSGHPPNPFAP